QVVTDALLCRLAGSPIARLGARVSLRSTVKQGRATMGRPRKTERRPFPHSTQARTDIDRIARRDSSLCSHCSDWPRASLKIAENAIWDKSRARGVHVPIAIALL